MALLNLSLAINCHQELKLIQVSLYTAGKFHIVVTTQPAGLAVQP